MASIEGLKDLAVSIGEDVKQIITEKPIETALVGAGIGGVLGVGSALIVGGSGKTTIRPKRKKRKTKKRTTRGIRRDRKFISKQKHEVRRRRKRKPAKIYKKRGKYWSRKPLRKAGSKKRVGKIYHTKKGQPYKIMASGKARFIKKGGRK